MRIISSYVSRSFLTAFGITLAVFTFVMCVGVIFKITDLLARGASAGHMAYIFLCGVPSALSFAIPVSGLTAALLVFGRLSANREITAMKACGMSLWEIMSTPLFIAAAMTAVCLFVNGQLAPLGRFVQRSAIRDLGMSSFFQLLEEGRFVRDVPGLTVYIDRKDKDRIYDVLIYDSRPGQPRREIRAQSGAMQLAPDRSALIVDLWSVRVDPFSPDRPGPGYCDHMPLRIPLDALRFGPVTKREGDLTAAELLARVRAPARFFPDLTPDALSRQRMALIVELNKRIVLAAACLAFVLVGAPLGIQAHRKESSIGVAISLFVMLSFYAFVIAADALSKRPELLPYVFLWIPIVAFAGGGTYLVRRAQ